MPQVIQQTLSFQKRDRIQYQGMEGDQIDAMVLCEINQPDFKKKQIVIVSDFYVDSMGKGIPSRNADKIPHGPITESVIVDYSSSNIVEYIRSLPDEHHPAYQYVCREEDHPDILAIVTYPISLRKLTHEELGQLRKDMEKRAKKRR